MEKIIDGEIKMPPQVELPAGAFAKGGDSDDHDGGVDYRLHQYHKPREAWSEG